MAEKQISITITLIGVLISSYCQDQSISDSLKSISLHGKSETEKFDILSDIISYETNPSQILAFSDTIANMSLIHNHPEWLVTSFMGKGNAYRLQGKNDLAIEALYHALNHAKETKSSYSIGNSLVALADVYSSLEDHKSAVSFYNEGVNHLRKSKDEVSLIAALLNFGDELLIMGNLDSARFLFEEAVQIKDDYGSDHSDYQYLNAYALGNLGLVHAEQGEYFIAEKKLFDAINILEDLGDTYGISAYQIYMADIYLKTDYKLGALIHATIAYENAIKHDLKEQIRDASLKLSEIYEKLTKTGKAIQYLKTFIQYSDSLTNPRIISRVAQIRQSYEVSQQKAHAIEIPNEITDSRPEYYALIIGVSDYLFDNETLVDLDQPTLDAFKLKETLSNSYTFKDENIILLRDPPRSGVINALEALSASITPNDNLLIFYAGHGIWDEKLNIGYWLPSDASIDSKANWLSNSRIRDYISGIKTKHTLLISDACFSGSIFKSRNLNIDAMESTLQVGGFAKVYKLPSRKAMTSGALNTVPDQSNFMIYLIKRLEENDKRFVSARQIFSLMETAVVNNTNNVPQYGTIQNAGDEGGDFIFIKK